MAVRSGIIRAAVVLVLFACFACPYQVVHNGLSAEFGGASGGAINVVTRAGGNTIHGDAFIFVQDAATNARDPFENQFAKPSFRRYRAGFAIGGPIVRSRTFYYAAIEQEHNRGQAASEDRFSRGGLDKCFSGYRRVSGPENAANHHRIISNFPGGNRSVRKVGPPD